MTTKQVCFQLLKFIVVILGNIDINQNSSKTNLGKHCYVSWLAKMTKQLNLFINIIEEIEPCCKIKNCYENEG